MKKCFIAFVLLFSLFGFGGGIFIVNTTEGKTIEMPKADKYDSVIANNKISDAIGEGNGIKEGIGNILSQDKKDLIKTINYMIASVALIWLSILGGKFVLSGGDEEKLSQYKMQFGWIILGLLVVSVAEYAGYKAFSPVGEEGLNDATGFVDITKKIVTFIQYLMGGIALLAGFRSGMALITGGDDEEVIQKEKEFVKIFLFALGLVLFAEAIETWIDLANVTGKGIDGEMINKEIIGLVNFALMFLSAAALFMVVLSSLYYVISVGNEDLTSRAKKMVTMSIVALVIAFSSYTIVSFLVG